MTLRVERARGAGSTGGRLPAAVAQDGDARVDGAPLGIQLGQLDPDLVHDPAVDRERQMADPADPDVAGRQVRVVQLVAAVLGIIIWSRSDQ